jgi:hypothetical protein
MLAEAAPTATLRIQRRPPASTPDSAATTKAPAAAQDPLGTVAWPVEPGGEEKG